ncbi:MAG: hypothetical protein IKZ53_01200 [Selenomonadaceae bacterium]|nr:hypothetical protein [Selenomonadaceae bacterium]
MQIFSRHKRFFAGIISATMIFSTNPAFAAEEDGEVITEVPTEIYMWVQSTPRANYWFNHQQIGYRVREDGTLDLETLMVPAIYIYDNIQIEDVIQKRKWRKLSTRGYDKLVGRSEMLKFDLKNMTVQVVEKTDLDDTWGALDKDTSGEPVDLKNFSGKDVMYKFYRRVLEWAREHNELIIGRSRGILSDEDGDLPINEVPINKIFIPPAEY